MGKLFKQGLNAINSTLAKTVTDLQSLRPTVDELRYELTHIFGATDTASGSVATFSDGAGGVAVKNVKVNITPSQSGSGDPSPSNIRPISGYTQADLYNDPKYGGCIKWNQLVLNGSFASTSEWTVSSGDTFTVSGNIATYKASARYHSISQWHADEAKANHKYLMTIDAQSYASSNVVFYCRRVVSGSVVETKSLTLTTTNKTYAQIVTFSDDGSLQYMVQDNNTSGWGNVTLANAMLIDLTEMFGAGNEPSTVDAFRYLFPNSYYPYNSGEVTCVSAVSGKPYSKASLPLGQTVYGGTLDLATGKVVVDHTMESFLWSNGTSSTDRGNNITSRNFVLSKSPKNYGSTRGDTITNIVNTYTYGTAGNVHFYLSSTTLVVFLSSDTDGSQEIQVWFELATPVTIQLTPEELYQFTLDNNIFSNCGTVEVTYRLNLDTALGRL